ncbi:MAG: ADP-ribosylation factor-like protein [Candidatus Thorarchaeota archaeon]
MIIHFSIVKKGGVEIYSFDSWESMPQLIDPELLSGFLTAIQLYSESMGNPIQQIQFSDFTFYFKSYGDFALRLMVLERLGDEKLEQMFNSLSKDLFPLISGDFLQSEKEIQKIVENTLSPYCLEINFDQNFSEKLKEATISKIALVGLAKAGKTSIKNFFFEEWSREIARNTQPTVRIDITLKFLDFINHKIAIHDFGGQVSYRKEYLQQEGLWKGISTLIFVVDIQDPNTFAIASEYLSNICRLIKNLTNELPPLSIFLHKYDVTLRKKLEDNIKKCFIHFREFTDVATFYLTTIDDSSSNVALIKALYFSLPEIVLKRLLEEEFLEYFESKILPKYVGFVTEENDLELTKPEIIKNATIHGMSIGYLLQKSWMDALIGEWTPRSRLLTSKSLMVERRKGALFITIPNWTDKDIPKEFTNTLLHGMLIGVLKTFQLPKPTIIHDTEYTTTWQVQL